MTIAKKTYTLELGNNNLILRSLSMSIDTFTKDIQILGKDLITLMSERKGVGLAAPQIGKNIRMIATSQRKSTGKKLKWEQDTLMINPIIITKQGKLSIDEEACLSLPNFTVFVERYSAITVEFYTLQGKKKIEHYYDFNARIIQHEIDHLDGILITDKAVK